MRPIRARAVASALVAALVVGLAGCARTSTGSQDRQLIVGATVAPNSMDPSTSNAAAIPQALLYNVYETLLKIDDHGNLQPLLASEWVVSPDGLRYTFKLRPEAKFSTGAAVDAGAVVTSVQRVINDASVLPVLKSQMSVVDSVRAVDATTVEFVLKHPSNFWLYSMAQTAGIIYEPSSLADLATKPVGSGPFVFSDWAKSDSVTLKRNNDYWGTKSRLAGVTFKYYADPNALNAAMLSGGLDVLSNVAAPQALDQFNDSRFTVLQGTTTGEIVLGYNHQTPALKDLRVRQAINYAIDRKALRDAVWAGKGLLIGSMVPPTDPWYEDLSGAYPYDPAKARALLADAGIAPGSLKLRLRVPTLPYATPAATYIASQLAQVGIQAQVDQLEFPATWIDQVLKNSNYDMTIVAHVETRDMTLWADPTYYWHYNNPQFQQLIAAADTATTQAQEVALMKQAARILSDDAAADFLWLLPNLVVTKADVTGVETNAASLSFDMTAVSAPPQ